MSYWNLFFNQMGPWTCIQPAANCEPVLQSAMVDVPCSELETLRGQALSASPMAGNRYGTIWNDSFSSFLWLQIVPNKVYLHSTGKRLRASGGLTSFAEVHFLQAMLTISFVLCISRRGSSTAMSQSIRGLTCIVLLTMFSYPGGSDAWRALWHAEVPGIGLAWRSRIFCGLPSLLNRPADRWGSEATDNALCMSRHELGREECFPETAK